MCLASGWTGNWVKDEDGSAAIRFNWGTEFAEAMVVKGGNGKWTAWFQKGICVPYKKIRTRMQDIVQICKLHNQTNSREEALYWLNETWKENVPPTAILG